MQGGVRVSLYTNYTGKLTNTTWVEAAAQIAGTDYIWIYDVGGGRVMPFAVKSISPNPANPVLC